MQRRLPFVIALTALCFFQAPQIHAQIFQSNVNTTDASPFPDPENKRDIGFEFMEGRRYVSDFRYEIYFDSIPNFNAIIEGPVIAYEGAFFEQFGGSTRSLELASDFSAAFIFDGAVEALNPGSGFHLIDIAGDSVVAFGDYDGVGGFRNETTEQWQRRVKALETPTNAAIFVSGGTVKAGIATGLNGDLSLGADGLLDVSAGRVEASFGDIAGQLSISGGEFTNLSINSLSGEINILGNELRYGETVVDSDGLQIDITSAGNEIVGKLTDESDFAFAILPELFDGGTVNLFTNNSEVNITPEDTSGSVNGGSDFSGGVEVSFDSVEMEGEFSSDAQITDIGELAAAVEADGATKAPDFELASEEKAQHWDLGFDGIFLNSDQPGAELVFGYDPLAIDVNEEDLAIFHFDDLSGEWEELEIIEHDLARNSIRVRTSSFSPFVLGAVTTAVPEPSSAVVLMGLMMSAAFRRRF